MTLSEHCPLGLGSIVSYYIRKRKGPEMKTLIAKLFVQAQIWMSNEEGQDLVEYALVVALVAFGATAALKTLGTGLNHAFTNISSTLASSLT